MTLLTCEHEPMTTQPIEYQYVTINASGNEAKHTAAFNEVLNEYAADGWRVAQMVRPSVIGPLGVLFERPTA